MTYRGARGEHISRDADTIPTDRNAGTTDRVIIPDLRRANEGEGLIRSKRHLKARVGSGPARARVIVVTSHAARVDCRDLEG